MGPWGALSDEDFFPIPRGLFKQTLDVPVNKAVDNEPLLSHKAGPTILSLENQYGSVGQESVDPKAIPLPLYTL